MRVIDKKSRPRPVQVSLALGAVILFCLAAGFGFFRYEFLRQVYHDPHAMLVESPQRYLESYLHGRDLPVLHFNLAYKHYEALTAQRREALEFGLQRNKGDWLPAEIESGGETTRIRLRLKGDLTDHIDSDKWSFRIKVRGEETFRGMKYFSVQHPKTRGYLSEWLFLENVRREGILAPRYEFVRVVLNGDDKGIYALEEHMAKELLESQRRREGPIARFDEGPFWEQRHRAQAEGNHWSSLDYLNFLAAEISFFQEKRFNDNPGLAEQAESAAALIEEWRTATRPGSEVFEVPLVARWLALSKMYGANHGIRFINLRWYYNPVTARLEPIGYDALASDWNRTDMWNTRLMGSTDPRWVEQQEYDLWVHRLLQDPVILNAYLHELHRVSRPEYLEKVTRELGPDLRDLRVTLAREWPRMDDPLAALQRGSGFVAGKLDPRLGLLGRLIPGPGSEHSLMVANVTEIPMEILAVRSLDEQTDIVPPLLLRERLEVDPVRWQTLPVPGLLEADSLLVIHRVMGSETERSLMVRLIDLVPEGPPAPDPDASPAEIAGRWPFLHWDDGDSTLHLLPGSWELDEDLSLPSGIPLVAQGGTVLRAALGVALIVRGPLHLEGTADSPIRLLASGDSWEGVVVLQAGETSRWKHVQVEGTKGITREGWILTGGVTFYESPVLLEDCSFLGHQGEDALNIIRTEFRMMRCDFRGTAADAFDGDFVTGSMMDCLFADVLGDAVDVSGAVLDIEGVTGRRVTDKMLSAGEQSQMRVSGLDLIGAGIAVASKDLSQVELRGGTVRNVRIGLAAYTKKPAYGPGWIQAENLMVEGAETPVLVQTGSWILWNGERFEGSDLAVDELYEQNILGN